MRTSITCCTRRDYLPQATRLAAVIRKEFGVECEFVKGDNGVFDVVVDGRRVFSTHEAARFPEEGEVAEALRRAGGAPG